MRIIRKTSRLSSPSAAITVGYGVSHEHPAGTRRMGDESTGRWSMSLTGEPEIRLTEDDRLA